MARNDDIVPPPYPQGEEVQPVENLGDEGPEKSVSALAGLSLHPKFPPAGDILGNPRAPRVLGKRNAILKLNLAGLHGSPPRLVPQQSSCIL